MGSLRHWLHNSLPASSFTNFIFCCPDGSHFSVDVVNPSLLRSSSSSSSSSSSAMWYHLQSLSSDVGLLSVSSLHVSKPSQSCFPAPLESCDTLYLESLPGVIVSHIVSRGNRPTLPWFTMLVESRCLLGCRVGEAEG